jgi:L-fuconolactonase
MASPPVIDAHQHFWDPAGNAAPPWPGMAAGPLRQAYAPADLAPELELERVSGTVAVAATVSTAETARLLALAAETAFVRGVVGGIDLGGDRVDADIASLRRGTGGDLLVGLVLPAQEPTDIGRLRQAATRRALGAVGEAGLAVDIDASPAALPAVLALCRSLPAVPFVLDHLGRPPIADGDLSSWGGGLLPLADLPNVSAKLSGLVLGADWHTWSIDDLRHPVELAIDAFGPSRLMLGSAWPACLVAGTYSDAIDAVRYLTAELSTIAQDEIRGGTAAHVYHLARSGSGRNGGHG